MLTYNKMKLCLCMIVKNESHIIRRCLDSVAAHISTYAIHDTGSTDDTVQLIKKFFEEREIDGILKHTEFVNFEKNRNEALETARETDCDYILLIDADMVLVVNSVKLNHDAYTLTQRDASVSYENMRLVKRDCMAQYIGVTHEYLSIPNGSKTGKVPVSDMYIQDLGDGGSKSNKFTRDADLLERYLETKPDCARSLFYLAQSYRDMGQTEKSIETYRRYLKAGSWEEEQWYAMYMIGVLLVNLDRDEALFALIQAYERRKWRAEPLKVLCEYCRKKKLYSIGWYYAKIGLKLKYPENDTLFIERGAYDHIFDHEIAIMAYYVDEKRQGLVTSNDLLLTNGAGSKDMVRKNIVFYLDMLEDIIPLRKTELRWMSGALFPMNPSIVNVDGDLIVNVRLVNYRADNHGRYTVQDMDVSISNPVATENVRMKLCTELLDDMPETINFEGDLFKQENLPSYQTVCIGLEDCRLFYHQSKIWFCATSRSISHAANNIMCIGDGKQFIELPSPTNAGCEKNWLPFAHNGDLMFLYSHCPLTILKLDIDSETLTEVKKKQYDFDMSTFRGSTAPVFYDEKTLIYVIHEVFPHYDVLRNYAHRFVWMDSETFEIIKVSKPFKLVNEFIEYASGLAINEGNVCLTFGVKDSRAMIATFKKDALTILEHDSYVVM